MKNTLKIRIIFVSILAIILAVTAFSGYYFNSEKVTAAVYDNQINYDSTGYLVGNFEQYSPIITYNEGDICLYNDGIYQCILDETLGISPNNPENWHRTSILSTIMNSGDNNGFHYSEVTKPGVSKTSNIKVTTTRDYMADYKLSFTGGLSTSTSSFQYDPIEENYYSNAYLKMDENDSCIYISIEYNGVVQNHTPLEYIIDSEVEIQEINLDELIDQHNNFDSILIAHDNLARTLSTNSLYTNNQEYFESILKYMFKNNSDYFGETLNSIKSISVSETINTIDDLFNNPAAISTIVSSPYGKSFLEMDQKFFLSDNPTKQTVAEIIAANSTLLKALGNVENINFLISDCLSFREALENSPLIETVTVDLLDGLTISNSTEKGVILLGYSSGYFSGSANTNTQYPTSVANGTVCYAIACPEINIEVDGNTTVLQNEKVTGEKAIYRYMSDQGQSVITGTQVYFNPNDLLCDYMCYFADSINISPMNSSSSCIVSCSGTPVYYKPTTVNINTPSKKTTITYIDLCK